MKSLTLLAAAFFVSGSSGSASTILFNFGAKTYSGTNSPGHVNGLATGTSWNSVVADQSSGIIDSMGNTTSVTLNFGTTASNDHLAPAYRVLDYSRGTRAADYSRTITGSVFDSNLGTSNAVRDVSGTDQGIGLSVSGLAPGQYVFYVTAFRGDVEANDNRVYDLYAGVAPDPITNFSTYSIGSVSNSNKTTWQAGVNYLTGTFTIDGTNDTFSLMSNSSGYVGVLSSLEIVAIPEPSSIAALALAPLFLGFRRRR